MILTNATVFTGHEVVSGASVRIANGLVQEVSTGPLDDADRFDLGGNWLIPGLVDLQVYGGSEQILNEQPTAATVEHISRTHLKNGTTSLLPTVYSTSTEVVRQAIAAVRQVRASQEWGVLGLHVEGPYINPEKRGVHSLRYVREPLVDELNALFAEGSDVIRIMTIAPEIFSADQLAALHQWTQSQTVLSLGHSNATYPQATRALNAGVPLATHLFNAMRPFESREPGVVGAVFDHPTVRASIVADGFHCDWATIRIARKVLQDRLFLISDAMFANPPRPAHAFDELSIQYDNGRYVNPEGKLAGSSITLLEAVRNCIRFVGIEPTEAFRMASTIPAEIIGLGDQLGKIGPGFVANLVVLNDQLALSNVLVNGHFQN